MESARRGASSGVLLRAGWLANLSLSLLSLLVQATMLVVLVLLVMLLPMLMMLVLLVLVLLQEQLHALL